MTHVFELSAAISQLRLPTQAPIILREDVSNAIGLLEKSGSMVDHVFLSRHAAALIGVMPYVIQEALSVPCKDPELRKAGTGSLDLAVTINDLVEVINRPIFAELASKLSHENKRHPAGGGVPITRYIVNQRLKELVAIGLVNSKKVKGVSCFSMTEAGRLFSESETLNCYRIIKKHFEGFKHV